MTTEVFEALESHDMIRLVDVLNNGGDPNCGHPKHPSWTPLKAAVEELSEGGSIDAVVVLLNRGAEVDGGRVPGNATPLLVAAMNNQPEAARLLLSAGADPNIRDDEGDTPFDASIRHGDVKMASLLKMCGATNP
jgi:uncharacterized protein